MASGAPVVAYARGGLVELVDDGATGFLVPFGDLDAAAERLVQLVERRDLRLALGAAGRRRVAERFSQTASTAALARAYATILPDPREVAAASADIVVPLPWTNRTPFADMFIVGERGRLATCTCARYITPDRVVTCGLLAREMYVVHADTEHRSAEIVATLPTVDASGEVSVDLADFDGIDRLVTANCEASTVSLYRLIGGTPVFDRSLPVDSAALPYCHVVSFVPGRPDLVGAALTTLAPRVQFVSLSGGSTPPPLALKGWIPKGITFAGTTMVVVWSRHNVSMHTGDHHAIRVTLVRLGARRHRVLDSMEFEGAADGIHAAGTRITLSDQPNDRVVVLHVEHDRLRRADDLVGLSFPHDATASPDGEWLAVATYGQSELRFRRIGPPG